TPEEILRISAKEGTNVPELLEAVVRRVPAPRGNREAPLRALIFDSYYDRYRGAIPSIRVVDGVVTPGMKIAFGAHKDDVYEVDEVGYLQLGHKPTELLEAGEVGYFVANTRGVRDTRSGDTVFEADHRDVPLLPGYRDIKSMVFAGLYPTNAEQFEELRDALAKLQLNDASLHYEPESSVALGFGFRCGFLGFYDKLKTISRGYASLDYEFLEYRPADLVKLDMLLNGEPVDAFSVIIHRDKAYEWGRKIAEKLKELIPRQLFEVVIQAAIG